jgi:hypothetical protein
MPYGRILRSLAHSSRGNLGSATVIRYFMLAARPAHGATRRFCASHTDAVDTARPVRMSGIDRVLRYIR